MNAPTGPGKQLLYISPVLQRLVAPHPDPLPACASCPASMWYVAAAPQGEQLKCFCSRMHVTSWDNSLEPVLYCDGRELGLIAIVEAEIEKEERKAEKEERRAEKEERKVEAAQRQADREAKKKVDKADRKVPTKPAADPAQGSPASPATEASATPPAS